MTVATVGVARETRLAIAAAVRGGLESLRAEPPMPLSEWAAEHFILAGESSQQKGAWTAWPFQVGMLDVMSDDRIEEVDIQKSKRVGYSKILTAFIGYTVARRRRNVAVWQPTDDDRDSFVKTEVDPMIEGVPAVKAARRARGTADETLKFKPFRGAVLHTLGGKAARAYRRITVAVALLDEWDAFDQSIEKSGDPRTLAMGRLEGAPFPKFVGGSTPRIKGLSHVESARQAADADLRYHVPCPLCGVEHPLTWGGPKYRSGFKWEAGEPATVRHVCPHCLGSIRQADYMPGGVPLTGAWVCERTGVRYGPDRVWRTAAGVECRPPRHVGMQVWSAYSPQRSWESIVREFEFANAEFKAGKPEPMQVFRNETLGETWEVTGEAVDGAELAARAGSRQLRTVPDACLVLTAGVDVQGNRLEVSVWGWGAGEECAIVDVAQIWGDPVQTDRLPGGQPTVWERLDLFLERRYMHEAGNTLAVEAVGIDTGGHCTHAVYAYCRGRAALHVRADGMQWVRKTFALKGMDRPGLPVKGKSTAVDVNHAGQMLRAGAKLWMVGVSAAKDWWHAHLRVTEPGPGFVHLARDLPAEWYAQMTSEQRVLARTARGTRHVWVKKGGKRNEAWDCAVYALFAAHAMDLHRYTEAMWRRLRDRIAPLQPDLLAQAAVSASRETTAPVPPQAAPALKAAASAPPPRPVSDGFGRGDWNERF